MKKLSALLLLAIAAIFGMQAQEQLYILGQVGAQKWDPSVGTPMEKKAEGEFYIRAHFNSSSYFSFTTQLASASDAWDEIKPYRFGAMSNNFVVDNLLNEYIACGNMSESSDNAFLIQKGADYDVTVYMLEDETMVLFDLIEGTEDELKPVVPDGNIYILGTVNGGAWDPANPSVTMTKVSETLFTAEIAVADSAANFSFTKAKTPNGSNDWAGIAPYRFAAVEGTSEVVLNTPLPLSEDGVDEPSFSILKGNYIFTLDLEARTLTVEPNEAESMYIIGADPFGGWNSNAGVKMEQASEGVYTYECEIAETAYFIFADALGGWDFVNNGHRYGPLEANEEVVVGEEMTTQISTNGSASYFVAPGKYVISFSKADGKFVFNSVEDGKKGDVNGDGKVEIDDVNALINILLGKADATDAANVDGVGGIDVQDVNVLINIILGK